MGKIYINQTALEIIVTVGIDITGALALLIKYTKPDGTSGSFNAVSTDDTNGIIKYEIDSSSDIDQAGLWHFWGHITFSDGSFAAGESHEEIIYLEGT